MLGRRPPATPFVGRARELAMLEDARLLASRRCGQIVLVGGEAGIGKTRLLELLVPPVRARRTVVVKTECLERVGQPLGPIRALVRALAAHVVPGAVERTITRAIAQLGPEPTSDPGPAEPPLSRAELFEAVVGLVLDVAARSIVTLTIEDVHWADTSTLDFLVYLAPRVRRARVLVGITYRTENLEPGTAFENAIGSLMRERCVRAVTLAPLAREDVRLVIAHVTGRRAGVLARDLRDIEERSDGNPFYAEELSKAASDEFSAPGSAILPLSIRASIAQRLGVLAPDERDVLATAAVLGYRFDPEVLALVLARSVSTLVPVLRRLRDLGIVVEESADRVRFRFKHALTRQAVFDAMLALDRRRLHEQILATLESLDDGDRHIEELAYHAWECRDAERTLRYNERAGAAALAVSAAAEADFCYRRALDVATLDADRARLLERSGTAMRVQGRLEEAIAAFQHAVSILLESGAIDAATHLFVTILAERYNRGTAAGATAAEAAAFLARHESAMSAPIRDDLLVFAARIAAGDQDHAAAERLLALVSPPERMLLGCRHNFYVTRMLGHASAGDRSAWAATVAELRALAEVSPRFTLTSLYTIAKTGTFLGAHDAVDLAFADAALVERDHDFPGLINYGWSLRALHLYLRGRLTDSRAALERALERSELFAARLTVGEAGALIGLALDDAALASRAIDVASGLESTQNEFNLASLYAGRVAAHVAHGREREAGDDARRALRSLRELQPADHHTMPAIARHVPELDLARLLELAREAGRQRSDVATVAVVAMVESIAAQRLGDATAAAAHAETAAAAYERLGWPLYAALAYELLGRSDDALENYHRCGALKDVRRLVHRGAAGTRARDVLSGREREIAELVAAGMTNAEIAQRLHISPKTVEKYVSSVFVKLSVRSRSALAALVARTRISA